MLLQENSFTESRPVQSVAGVISSKDKVCTENMIDYFIFFAINFP